MRGVRKVTSGASDVNTTTAVDLPSVDAKCCDDPLSRQPLCVGLRCIVIVSLQLLV